MKDWVRQGQKSLEGREAITSLGSQLYRHLPEHLRKRWGGLKPAELGILALAMPEELPPEVRHLLK